MLVDWFWATAPGTRCLIAPIGNLRPAIVEHRPLIVKQTPLFGKVAQLFSLLRPLIVNCKPAIAKLAQLFGNRSPDLAALPHSLLKWFGEIAVAAHATPAERSKVTASTAVAAITTT